MPSGFDLSPTDDTDDSDFFFFFFDELVFGLAKNIARQMTRIFYSFGVFVAHGDFFVSHGIHGMHGIFSPKAQRPLVDASRAIRI